MSAPQPTKAKRSTMACIHCRERKVKCENNNDGKPCKRCKKTEKDCRYEPVNPIADSQQAPPLQGEPPITGDKPIMTVYQDSLPSRPPQPVQWPGVGDPQPQGSFPEGRQLHPYDPMNAASPQFIQPPQAYQSQFPLGWQPPFIQPHATQFSYGQGENSYPVGGPAFWMESRTSTLSNMPHDHSGDQPEDSAAEPRGSS